MIDRLVRATSALLLIVGFASCAPTNTGADFQIHERALLGIGKLRTVRDPPDAPYSNADLARHFRLIAFGLEAYLNENVSHETDLSKWAEPIRWFLQAPPSERTAAVAETRAFMRRLARITGLDIAQAGRSPPNMEILILGPDDYGPVAARLRLAGRDRDASLIEEFRTGLHPCRGRGYVRNEAEGKWPAQSISHELILVRAGFSELFRKSCLEEEIAQGLGLFNDDPTVRPTIFNDDEEFALLTAHDELLLKILYDPRLKSGMGPQEAMPLVRAIIEDLRPRNGS